MDERVGRITKWLGGGFAYPFKVDVFISEKCNLNCVFCGFARTDKRKKELTPEQLISIVDEAGRMGAGVFGILGGEPFARRDAILEVMSRIKEYGMDGSIVTNGTLLNDEAINTVIRIGWDLIRFSIDGSVSGIHDKLRGQDGAFDRAVKAVTRMQELKKQLDTNKPTVEINTVFCRENIDDLPNIYRMAGGLGVGRVYLLPMIELVPELEHLKITREDGTRVAESIRKAKKICNEYGILSNLKEIEGNYLFTKSNEMDEVILKKAEMQKQIPCFLPWYGMCVSADGGVTPCAVLSGDESYGNVNYNTLNEIWIGEPFSKLRSDMKERRLPKACSRCCMPLVDENNMIREELSRMQVK
ncbi:MAG: radical SAM protein [archaeon]